MTTLTDLETLRRRLESLLESGHSPSDPEVLAVSQELDRLVVAAMTASQQRGEGQLRPPLTPEQRAMVDPIKATLDLIRPGLLRIAREAIEQHPQK